MPITKGAYRWRVSQFAGGQDSYHSPGEIPDGCHRVLRNFWTDGETLETRGGHTGIPTSGGIGATNTVGVRGLYIWRPYDGTRHIAAVYPRAASANRLSLYFVHTASATTLGGEFATAPRVSMAGFGDRLYLSDGRTRLKYTDGVSTAEARNVDSPAVVVVDIETPANIRPGTLGIKGTAPHASKYPEYMDLSSTWRFPLYRSKLISGKNTWTASGTGLTKTIATGMDGLAGAKADEWNMRLRGGTGLVAGAKAYYSFATGGTTTIGGYHFWCKGSTAGQYLKLEFSGGGTVRARDNAILFNQANRWEFKQQMFDHLAQPDRRNIGSARIVVTDPNRTFTAEFSNIYIDGLQQGEYEVAAALYDSDNDIESPLGEVYPLRADRGAMRNSAFSFPGLYTKDTRVDRVRWYRRGGASPEWRLAAEVPQSTQAWDFGADIDLGDIAKSHPGPAPRASILMPIGYSRMGAFGGFDHGDHIPGIPTGVTLLATNMMTALATPLIGGISRGVELYVYTSQAAYTSGTFAVTLGKSAAAVRRTVVNAKSLVPNRWNTILWTGGYPIEAGSGVYALTFSGMANCNFRIASYTSGLKPSYYHLLDYPRRVWKSREGKPDWFDRYTRMEAADTDGFWYDLPGEGGGKIVGVGRHGSYHLIGTENEIFLDIGDSAADASCMRINSGIGVASHETFAEGDNWTLWVSGVKGRLKVQAYGPRIQPPVTVSAEDWTPGYQGSGFNRVGLAIEPILNQITDPTKMSGAVGSDGRYHLWFGEVVTYGGNSYTSASLNLASWGWETHYASATNVKPPRFAVTDTKNGKIILASPASSSSSASSNRIWEFDSTRKDGAQKITYLYETRHRGVEDSRISKLRGYEIDADQATAGPMTVNAYANDALSGTMVHSLSAAGAGQLRLSGRFGPAAQGLFVGMKMSGTSATAVTIRSVTAYLDAKR